MSEDSLKIGTAAPGYFTGVPCERIDCRFEENGPTTTTLLGWKKVYDKSGMRVDGGDPNWETTPFYCLTCDRRWKRSRRGTEVQWSEDRPASLSIPYATVRNSKRPFG